MEGRVLFVHGAGERAHEEDFKMAASLQGSLGDGYEVRYPEMPDAGSPRYAAWRDRLKSELVGSDGEFYLVGHSLGGSVLLKYLSEEEVEERIVGVFLVAAPVWGAEDWEVDEYALQRDFARRLPEKLPVFFYHSRDDETVPSRTSRSTREKSHAQKSGSSKDAGISSTTIYQRLRATSRGQEERTMDGDQGNYARVNGLEMYHELHGTGPPLVMLHGAFMTIGAPGTLVSALSGAHRVVAVELHGHTARSPTSRWPTM